MNSGSEDSQRGCEQRSDLARALAPIGMVRPLVRSCDHEFRGHRGQPRCQSEPVPDCVEDFGERFGFSAAAAAQITAGGSFVCRIILGRIEQQRGVEAAAPALVMGRRKITHHDEVKTVLDVVPVRCETVLRGPEDIPRQSPCRPHDRVDGRVRAIPTLLDGLSLTAPRSVP